MSRETLWCVVHAKPAMIGHTTICAVSRAQRAYCDIKPMLLVPADAPSITVENDGDRYGRFITTGQPVGRYLWVGGDVELAQNEREEDAPR